MARAEGNGLGVDLPLHFVAAQPPGFTPGEPVLVAQGLHFTQSIIQPATPLKVGDSLTRHLTLQAKDQALLQFRQSLTTLHSRAEHNKESVAPALRPLNPVLEKDFP